MSRGDIRIKEGELVNLKLGVKWKKRRRGRWRSLRCIGGKWRSRKESESRQVSICSSPHSILGRSCSSGTGCLNLGIQLNKTWWENLLLFFLPKSVPFFLVTLSEEIFPLVLLRLHSLSCLILMSSDPKTLSSVFLLFVSFLTFNLNRPRTLSFICWLTHLCSFSFPASVVLASLFSSPFTLVHLLVFLIYIFSLSHNSCALPSLCLSLSLPRLSLPLYLSPVSSSETFGAKLSLSVLDCFFLNLSLFLSGCLILTKASKRGKKKRTSLFQILFPSWFFFFKGKQEVLKSVQLLVLSSCPNRVSVCPAHRHPVKWMREKKKQEWKDCFWWVEWRIWKRWFVRYSWLYCRSFYFFLPEIAGCAASRGRQCLGTDTLSLKTCHHRLFMRS